MAVMVIFNSPEMTLENYDSLRPIVNWEQDAPSGLLLHSCAFDESGGLHVFDLWESAEQMQDFFGTRLGTAFQQIGVNPPPPLVLPVHNVDAYPGIEKHTP
ncbi:MAG: hypothetical protein M3R04_07905 [bacterium]|nr:hypothetical protein [bacterium]